MASDTDTPNICLLECPASTTTFRLPSLPIRPFKRRRMLVVRLGGRKTRKGMLCWVRQAAFRSHKKLTSVKVKYLCFLKKIRSCSRSLLKGIGKGTARMDFVIPVMDIIFDIAPRPHYYASMADCCGSAVATTVVPAASLAARSASLAAKLFFTHAIMITQSRLLQQKFEDACQTVLIVVAIKGFHGFEDENEMIGYMLKDGSALHFMLVNCYAQNRKAELLKEICSFPRKPPACEIEFID